VADSTGLSAEVTRDVQPNKVTMDFTSEPSGMTLILDGYEVTTPYTGVSWDKHELKLQAPHQDQMVFESWSDGGSQIHYITVGAGGSDFHAVFREWKLNTLLVNGSTGITSDDGPVAIDGLEGVVIEQLANGKLVVMNSIDAITIWESNPTSDVEDTYRTSLQSDGNMITRRLSDNAIVWASQDVGGGVDATCESSFLAIEALAQTLGIYCGTADNNSGSLWTIETEPLFAPSAFPTVAPTTLEPTRLPTRIPTTPAEPTADPAQPTQDESAAVGSHDYFALLVSFGLVAALVNF